MTQSNRQAPGADREQPFTDLAERLADELRSHGAALVGYGSLEGIPDLPYPNLTRCVSFAVALNPEIVREIKDGPTPAYLEEYHRANALLDKLAAATMDILGDSGYEAETLTATMTDYGEELAAAFPHKTAATRAGIGWIGNTGVLITPEYGNAIRLGTVFTDAPLPPAHPINVSLCGACTKCSDFCPVGAPRGARWDTSKTREDLIDIKACQAQCRRFAEALGTEHDICGICIANCPWTIHALKLNKR